MRQIITIIAICFLFISCGQKDNKQKELELKERELAIKEKELELQAKEKLTSSIPLLDTIKNVKAENVPKEEKIIETQLATNNINSLRNLDGSDLKSNFFDNKIIRQRLRKLLGKERFSFMEGYWSIGTPVKLENDVLITTGCMSHFCPSTNFIVIIDIAKNTFHAGIRDDDRVKTYSENENNKTGWIQQKMQHWIEYGSD